MTEDVVLELAREFGALSLLSIGGVNALIPEIHRRIVEVHGWMSDGTFSELFAIAQAAPGPNFLIVTIIGFQVASMPGALAATLALCGPTSAFTYAVAHAWDRFRESRGRAIIQRALAPLTVGLMFASGYVLSRAADHTIVAYLATLATAAVMLWTRVHPLAMLGVAALLGIAGWI